MTLTTEKRNEFIKRQKEIIQDGSFMQGSMFMPNDGYCYHCRGDVLQEEINRGNDGSKLVTGCMFCYRSYCE